jgi:hypothetical protein
LNLSLQLAHLALQLAHLALQLAYLTLQLAHLTLQLVYLGLQTCHSGKQLPNPGGLGQGLLLVELVQVLSQTLHMLHDRRGGLTPLALSGGCHFQSYVDVRRERVGMWFH